MPRETNPAGQGRFKHVAGDPGVLSNDHLVLDVWVTAKDFGDAFPGHQGDIRRYRVTICLPANAVSSEEFSHVSLSSHAKLRGNEHLEKVN